MITEATNYKKAVNDLLVFDDWEAIDIFLAAVIAHKLKGNMFWLRIIGASGSGKSEILRSLQPHNGYCVSADTFTPGAVRGGYKPKEGTLPRMLDDWNNKIVLTKDFASVISKKKEDRGEVFGLLRNAWDGTLDAYFGSEDSHVHLEFHFDWILASTPYIERQQILEAELGSRFINLQWRLPKDEIEAIIRAGEEDCNADKKRQVLADCMGEILNINPSSNFSEDRWLASVARIASRCRTPVYRDKNHQIYDIPTPELATRLYQGMRRIAIGLQVLGVENYKPHMKRIALDCLPRIRRRIIEEYILYPNITQQVIADKVNVSRQVIATALDDLKLLGFNKESLDLFRVGVLRCNEN